MHRGWIYALVLPALVVPTPAAPAQDRPVHPPYVLRRFDAIKPPAHLLPWQQIPWLTDLEEGLRVSKRENRPLLIWGSDDEPLDRC